ncbi:hypothetical protein EW146_g7320, partial [Bondarzewia mesenterica]
MSAEREEYLAVLKASYDYTPQSDDEIQVKEDQILLLIEKTDEDWWKVKIKGDSPDDEGPAGLVPAAYIEQAEPTATVKVQYDYDAASQGELSVKEDQILLAFGNEEEGWLLVQTQERDKAGYVPGNYVEESTGDDEPAAPVPAQIIIPDSPPRRARPVSTYTDPADLVAATASRAKADGIQTWAIAEVDKKGKKKKGTLGIGNGAIFFASEADKTPVQKWQTAHITSAKIDKTKHVLIDIGGASPISLHFNVGSKDTAEAITTKLESSRAIASGSSSTPAPEPGPSPPADPMPETRSLPPPIRTDGSVSPGKKGASVHFSELSPAIIPPRDADESDEDEPAAEEAVKTGVAVLEAEGEEAVALYDFQAQGDDELTVLEGEQLWIIERDGDEWWKCRNIKGDEGVVPASYIEPSDTGTPAPPRAVAAAVEEDEEDDTEAREAEARAEAERVEKEKERKRQEQEQRAKAVAAAAEVERKRKEREVREAEQKARDRAVAAVAAEVDTRRSESPRPTSSSKSKGSLDGSSRSSMDKRGPPPAEKTRVWHDRSGQFRVEAAFLGFANGKIRLHKVNGVVIEVPSEKMSVEDMNFVTKLMSRKQSSGSPVPRSSADDDDEPLAARRTSLRTDPRKQPNRVAPKKGPTVDWFEFFLNAGCDIDDCTRYASAFERDKIDEAILADITEGTMRSLGLREGDIIRVRKAIEQRAPKPASKSTADENQVQRDEELAGQLLSEETKQHPVASPPNLFAGPGGALKTARRGRPQPSKSLPPTSVDINAISTASDQIQRSVTPQAASPNGIASPVQAPARTASALAVSSGFDDDAWTNRPSSTKPIAPTPPV